MEDDGRNGRTGTGIKRIDRAVGVEAREVAAEIGRGFNRGGDAAGGCDGGAGGEGRAAIGAGGCGGADRRTRCDGRHDGIEGGEIAADQNLAVSLEGERTDLAAGVGIVGGVERAVGVEAREVAAGGGTDQGKGAGDDKFAIGLADDGQDATIGCGGHVGGIDGAIRVQAGEIIPGEAADGGERTADDDLAVGLHEGDERTTFGVDLERGVEGAVSADPGEAIAEGPRREAARLD